MGIWAGTPAHLATGSKPLEPQRIPLGKPEGNIQKENSKNHKRLPSGAALMFYKFGKLLSQNRFFGKVGPSGQNFHRNSVLEEPPGRVQLVLVGFGFGVGHHLAADIAGTDEPVFLSYALEGHAQLLDEVVIYILF